MKHILVPTDFSKNAWIAARYALTLFKETECVIYFLNTYTPAIHSSRFMSDPLTTIESGNTTESSSKNGLSKIIKQVKRELPSSQHSYNAISSFSLVIDEVKEAVERFQIDYLVVGLKGATNAEDVFMGSTTVKILRTGLNCPVLAVPAEFKFKRNKKLSLLANFNWFHSPEQLVPLIDIAKRFPSAIDIVNVELEPSVMTAVQQFNFEMLQKHLANLPHTFHWIRTNGNISQDLETFMTVRDIQLLVMIFSHYSVLEQLTRNLVIKKSEFYSKVPLLVIPEVVKVTSKAVGSRNTMSVGY